MPNGIKNRTMYVLTRINKADNDDTDIYVGSTSLLLNQRLYTHRCDAKKQRYKNNRLQKRMREEGLENWEILPLLSRQCGVKTMNGLVRKWIGVLQADLNSQKEHKKEYDAAY